MLRAQTQGPSLAMEEAGNALLVWPEKDGASQYQLYSSYFDSSTAQWGTPVLAEQVSGSATAPSLTLSNGRAAIAWRHYSPSGVYVNQYDTTNGWGSAENIGSSAAINPTVTGDGSGNLMVSWTEYSSPNTTLKTQRYQPGLGWDEVHELATASTSLYYRQAMDGQGNLVIIWWGQNLQVESNVYRLSE